MSALDEQEAKWKQYATGDTFVPVSLLLEMCADLRAKDERIAELEAVALAVASEIMESAASEECAECDTEYCPKHQFPAPIVEGAA